MYKIRQFKFILVILLLLIGILSFKLNLAQRKFIQIKNQVAINITKDKSVNIIEKYGYSDILECLRENSDFGVKSINMLENEKCNVEVDFKGDVETLYDSLYSLNESRNFLDINSIIINKDTKIINISIDFKKNK